MRTVVARHASWTFALAAKIRVVLDMRIADEFRAQRGRCCDPAGCREVGGGGGGVLVRGREVEGRGALSISSLPGKRQVSKRRSDEEETKAPVSI